jgi:hypothetical protein
MNLAVIVLVTLNLAVIVLITLRRRAARAPGRPDRTDPAPVRCPGCGTPLQLGPIGPDRLIGVCPARRCSEIVILRRLEGWLVVVGRRRR